MGPRHYTACFSYIKIGMRHPLSLATALFAVKKLYILDRMELSELCNRLGTGVAHVASLSYASLAPLSACGASDTRDRGDHFRAIFCSN
jgi:hypothetical protein